MNNTKESCNSIDNNNLKNLDSDHDDCDRSQDIFNTFAEIMMGDIIRYCESNKKHGHIKKTSGWTVGMTLAEGRRYDKHTKNK